MDDVNTPAETPSEAGGGGLEPPAPPTDSAGGAAGGGESIVETEIQRELTDSYLTYAMSTIMDRALPDVRDGLKPSQRRILVAMNDLNLRPGRKHLKCAKICGNTSGDYHPHGEGVVYPTLVGMAQKWRMRVPLVDPQGNFGSIEGDAPAAMRYTEARMTHAAVDLLADLDLDTVDTQPNYDDRLMEPTVLPGKFPNLLINGSVGIAVGMACSLPPHNPTEIFDAIVRVIDRRDITLPELMTDEVDANGTIVRHGVKGPDFPTGGVIQGRAGILEAYSTGRGRVVVRGTCHVEDLKNERQQLVIDQIPYLLAQEGVVKRISDAVGEDKVKDVWDARDESGREAQTRIVLELKKGADPRVVENQLYQFTSLEDTFSVMNIALVNRQPRTLTLKELIERYIEHRIEVIRRRTAFLLREAKKRAHLLEARIYAVCDIDEVIKIIRGSSTRDEAINKLMARHFRIPPSHKYAAKLPARFMSRIQSLPDGEALTRQQAEEIGGLRLIQLVGLEIEKLVSEYQEVVGEIEGYEAILADPIRVLNMIKADCEEMKQKYGSPRRTRIEEVAGDISVEALIQVEDMAVTISRQGYAKRVPLKTYRQQGRGGKGIIASDAKDDDFIEHLFVASTHDDLLVFTDTGRVFRMKVYELPELRRNAKGRPLVNLLDFKQGERPCAYLAIKDFESGSHYLTFVSRDGVVKRTALKDYRNVHKSGIIAVGLKEGDALLDVELSTGTDDLLVVTASGMAIRFNEEDVRLMGRSAAGVKGIDLGEGDQVVGVVRIPMKPDADGDLMTADPGLSLLTVTVNGYGKRTVVDEYRVQPETGKPRSQTRGGKGRLDIDTEERNGRSVAAIGVHDADDVVVITKNGKLVRMPAAEIRQCGRGTKGVRVVGMDEGDAVVAVAPVVEAVPAEGEAAG